MSWETKELGELAKISKGKKYLESFSEKSTHRYINIEDLHGGNQHRYTNENGVKVNENDVIIAWDGANAGKVGVGFNGVIGSTLAKINLNKKGIDSKYIFWYLDSINVKIKSQRTGATIPHVNGPALKELQVPLPPLHIQKQIANILDKADALRKKDHQLLQKYDELAQSIFIDMFGDPVKNEKGWEVKKLGDCLKRIQIGPFGTQLHVSDYVTDGIPLINPMHIGDLKIKPNYAYSITKQKFEELPQYHLQKDDVILARRGEMGRCAIVTKLEAGFICGTGSLFLTTSKEKLDPVFLVYLMSRNSTKSALEKSSAGTTMSNLNKTIINNFNIITPPISKQKIFKQSIQKNQEMIELLKKSIKKSESLFQNLLQKVFTGELIND